MLTFGGHGPAQICGGDGGSIQYYVWPKHLSAELSVFTGSDAFVYHSGLPGAEPQAQKDQHGRKPEVGGLIFIGIADFHELRIVCVKVLNRYDQSCNCEDIGQKQAIL